MSKMFDFNEQTVQEWRKLGFYYEYEKDLQQWRLWGSKAGLYNFIEQISQYANSSSNSQLSEHVHLGPYNYLKIMTWNKAIVNEKYIAGTLSDLQRLSQIIENKLGEVNVGEIFTVFDEYSTESTCRIMFIVMAANFDPGCLENF